MGCETIRIGGMTAIVCGRGLKRAPKCWVKHCWKPSTKLCDHPVPDPARLGATKTCDRKICDDHADPVGPDRHLCPAHSIEAAKAEMRTGP